MSVQKTVLVTGATKGIGLEVARQLAARGARVIVAARNQQEGGRVTEQLGAHARFLHLDVSNDASVEAAARDLSRQVDRLDAVINNAAILLDGNSGVLDLAPETLRQTLETNLLGPWRVARAFVALLRKSDAPRIVNISSGAGQLSDGLQSWAPAYSISKTALNSLTQQLASALPQFAVNSVCPGWVRTDMGGQSAPRSVEQGADTSVWLVIDAPQSLTGKFLRDREVIPW